MDVLLAGKNYKFLIYIFFTTLINRHLYILLKADLQLLHTVDKVQVNSQLLGQRLNTNTGNNLGKIIQNLGKAEVRATETTLKSSVKILQVIKNLL